jgi:hypothetical protein
LHPTSPLATVPAISILPLRPFLSLSLSLSLSFPPSHFALVSSSLDDLL